MLPFSVVSSYENGTILSVTLVPEAALKAVTAARLLTLWGQAKMQESQVTRWQARLYASVFSIIPAHWLLRLWNMVSGNTMASKTNSSSIVVDTLTQSYTHANRDPACCPQRCSRSQYRRPCQVEILLIVETRSIRGHTATCCSSGDSRVIAQSKPS